jgi:uncharacterized membrane protein YgdD (TMEM256/DUF423 family)
MSVKQITRKIDPPFQLIFPDIPRDVRQLHGQTKRIGVRVQAFRITTKHGHHHPANRASHMPAVAIQLFHTIVLFLIQVHLQTIQQGMKQIKGNRSRF